MVTCARIFPLLAAVTPRSRYLKKDRRPATRGAVTGVACASLSGGTTAFASRVGAFASFMIEPPLGVASFMIEPPVGVASLVDRPIPSVLALVMHVRAVAAIDADGLAVHPDGQRRAQHGHEVTDVRRGDHVS